MRPVATLTWFRLHLYVRNSLWVVPFVLLVLGIVLGYLASELDETFPDLTLGLSPDGAKSILSTISSGMLTFTGVVFSVVLLAIQFGSSQFSPRLLRVLFRRWTTKLAFGTFLATYDFTLIAQARVEPAGDPGFVPAVSVVIALILIMASLILFIALLSTVANGLRAANVVRSIGRDGLRVIERMYPESLPSDAVRTVPESIPGPFRQVTFAAKAGVIVAIDLRSLVTAARRSGATIVMVPAVGDFIIPGEPLFAVEGEHRRFPDRFYRRMVATGDERTIEQDPKFAFRLLVDIANKGLSRAINDPTTAVQAIDQVNALLLALAPRRLDVGVIRDANGKVLVGISTPRWDDFVELGIGEVLRYGEGSLQIARRLRALLDELLATVPAMRRPQLEILGERLKASVERAFTDPEEREFASQPDRQGVGSTDQDERWITLRQHLDRRPPGA